MKPARAALETHDTLQIAAILHRRLIALLLLAGELEKQPASLDHQTSASQYGRNSQPHASSSHRRAPLLTSIAITPEIDGDAMRTATIRIRREPRVPRHERRSPELFVCRRFACKQGTGGNEGEVARVSIDTVGSAGGSAKRRPPMGACACGPDARYSAVRGMAPRF
jgi:hypothetical protein